MWDIRIVTYHHGPQVPSTAVHSINIDPMVDLSQFLSQGSTYLSVSNTLSILIQNVRRAFVAQMATW